MPFLLSYWSGREKPSTVATTCVYKTETTHWLTVSCFDSVVDPLGLEPRMTIPKTVVLPLHHGSMPAIAIC